MDDDISRVSMQKGRQKAFRETIGMTEDIENTIVLQMSFTVIAYPYLQMDEK